jgi:hypothetical protein
MMEDFSFAGKNIPENQSTMHITRHLLHFLGTLIVLLHLVHVIFI